MLCCGLWGGRGHLVGGYGSLLHDVIRTKYFLIILNDCHYNIY